MTVTNQLNCDFQASLSLSVQRHLYLYLSLQYLIPFWHLVPTPPPHSLVDSIDVPSALRRTTSQPTSHDLYGWRPREPCTPLYHRTRRSCSPWRSTLYWVQSPSVWYVRRCRVEYWHITPHSSQAWQLTHHTTQLTGMTTDVSWPSTSSSSSRWRHTG